MSLTIRELSNTKAERTEFINFPWKIYQDYENWVPPLKMDMHTLLNPDKHPFHQHADSQLFLAERNGEVVGRITAHVNHRHNEIWEDKVGFFGFFECVNDQEVADALFDAASEYLRARDRSHVRGPFSWSTNEECGLLVDAFDKPPVIMMPYNPPYYEELITGAGLKKIKDLLAYKIDSAQEIPERLSRGVELLKKRYNFSVRQLDMKNFWSEVEIIKKLYNDIWSKNWGGVPMTDAEFDHLAKELKMIVNPKMCFIVEREDEVIGVSITIPDANEALIRLNGRLFPFGIIKLLWNMRKVHFVRVFILGVKEKYRHHGIDAAMYHKTFDNGIKYGFNSGEQSWVLEDNYAMRNALKKFGAEQYKTYRIFEQAL
jgi:hypothetical protein